MPTGMEKEEETVGSLQCCFRDQSWAAMLEFGAPNMKHVHFLKLSFTFFSLKIDPAYCCTGLLCIAYLLYRSVYVVLLIVCIFQNLLYSQYYRYL